ncbi:hypothetical protein TrCOL_g10529, partial [Triparma columacea]
ATPPSRRSRRPTQRYSDGGYAEDGMDDDDMDDDNEDDDNEDDDNEDDDEDDDDYKDSQESDRFLTPDEGDTVDRPKVSTFNVGDQTCWYRIVRSVTPTGLSEAVDLKLDNVTKQCVAMLKAETREFWVDFPPHSCNVIARNMQNAAVNMIKKVFHRAIERFVARVIDLEVFRFRAETENATDELKALPKYEKKYSRATFVRKASAWLIDP